MALTSSSIMPLGTVAPDFTLLDTISSEMRSLQSLKGKNATVIMFICNHCPFVKHIQQGLVNAANDYIKQGITFVAISANDIETHPEDAPDKMRELALALNFPFAYLYDETQDVAKAYQAACTPEFFIFNKELHCVYRGAFDDAKPGNDKPVTGHYLRKALGALLNGQHIDEKQVPSMGCNIKWK